MEFSPPPTAVARVSTAGPASGHIMIIVVVVIVIIIVIDRSMGYVIEGAMGRVIDSMMLVVTMSIMVAGRHARRDGRG